MGKNKNVYLRIGLICIGLGLLGLTSVLIHWAIFGLRGAFIPNYQLTGMIEFVPMFEQGIHALFLIAKTLLVLCLCWGGVRIILNADFAKRVGPSIMLFGLIFEIASLCRILFNQVRFMDRQQEFLSSFFSGSAGDAVLNTPILSNLFIYWVPGFILYTLIWQGMKIAFFERSRRVLSQRSGEEPNAEQGA
jgi:hypothetical protein